MRSWGANTHTTNAAAGEMNIRKRDSVLNFFAAQSEIEAIIAGKIAESRREYNRIEQHSNIVLNYSAFHETHEQSLDTSAFGFQENLETF